MVDDYMLEYILTRLKEIIATETIDDTKILIQIDDNLPYDITF